VFDIIVPLSGGFAIPRKFETTRDSEVFQTGSWSLRIRFSGTENVDYRHLTQRVIVEPGRHRFRAQLRSEGVAIDQGVGFRIFAVDRTSPLNVETALSAGTADWTVVETTFTVPRPTRLLEIQLLSADGRESSTARSTGQSGLTTSRL
jgi:hypothetical protein